MVENPNLYHYCTEIHGHEGPIRSLAVNDICLIAGSQDSSARVWSLFENSGEISAIEGAIMTNHNHWVTSVLLIPPNTVACLTSGGFVTGSLDKMIRIFDSTGSLVSTAQGHEGGIISLAFTVDNFLVSGSWDGSARIWDIHSDPQEIAVLRGHENGVTVLCMPDDRILTTSTGYQSEDTIIDFKIRVFSKFDSTWRETNQLCEHTGPIRKLCALHELGLVISCSNDGSVIVYDDVTLQISSRLLHQPSESNTDNLPFVLDVTCALSSIGPMIASAGEDGSILIWLLSSSSSQEQEADNQWIIFQRLFHPCSVWCLCIQPISCNIITGGHDGIVRIFSNLQHTTPQSSVLADYQSQVETYLSSSSPPLTEQERSQLIPWSLCHLHPGASDGEIRMFINEQEDTIAGRWDDSLRTWINVGNVTGVKRSSDGFRSGVVNGVEYEIVFDIELPLTTTTVPLGMHRGENPYVVAQRFVDEYELSQAYKRQITDYIYKRLESTNSITRLTGDVSKPANRPMVVDDDVRVFHSRQCSSFTDVKSAVSSLLSRLMEVTKDEELNLTILTTLTADLIDTLHYHTHRQIDNIDSFHLTCVLILLKLPLNDIFPLMDLIRLCSIHPTHFKLLISPFTIQLFNSNYFLSKYSIQFTSCSSKLSQLSAGLNVNESTSYSILDIVILLFRNAPIDSVPVTVMTFRMWANMTSTAIQQATNGSDVLIQTILTSPVNYMNTIFNMISNQLSQGQSNAQTTSAIACLVNLVELCCRQNVWSVISDVLQGLSSLICRLNEFDDKFESSVSDVLFCIGRMLEHAKREKRVAMIRVFKEGMLAIHVQQALGRVGDSHATIQVMCDNVSTLIAEFA